ncbi:unnamed protein product [Cylindrotheca closterium]|uniref:G-protein coupled receptors family 3 profile domain-containing protein n=1 Tax=Cylindrotheca closterium TaxID=2856 RepID=A0AAD2FRZ5_9STRA|nr:unnamed protein product [Cylindrotheca closterium]
MATKPALYGLTCSVRACLVLLISVLLVSPFDYKTDHGFVLLGVQAFAMKTISVTRGIIEPDNFFTGEDLLLQQSKELPGCEYDGGQILLSHPSSLAPENRQYGTANLMLEAAGITIDRINNERCGVKVDGKSYALRLKTYSDDSDKNKTAAVTRAIVNESDFMLAGYTSGLAAFQTPVAEDNKKLVITAGSSSTSVHSGKKYAFGMLPPASAYFGNAYRAMAQLGARTIGFLYDDDFTSCKPEFAEAYGFEVIYTFAIGENKSYDVFDEAAYNVSRLNPDSMVTCSRLTPEHWVNAMRKHNWNPKAQVTFGNVPLEEAVGTDAQHMMTVSSWVDTLPHIPDAVTGWTPKEFAIEFETAAHRPPDYRQVAQSAAISVLVQAIESAGSIHDADKVVEHLQNKTFDTVYAKVSFDENGQNDATGLLLQYDIDNVAQVALPESLNRDFEIVYPMPSWKKRDCTLLSDCLRNNGDCMDDGTCSCPSGLIQFGNGETASCKELPSEDMTYIGSKFLYVGYSYVVVQCITSAIFGAWAIWNRNSEAVRASQPMFLHLISFGCFILALSIIPMTFQGGYRYYRDPDTLEPTHIFNDNIHNVDKSCMAFPWMFGIGFGIVFSALFAKIHRIREILASAIEFRRKRVQARDVLYLIAVVLSIECTILLVWQFVDPLLWERDIIRVTEDAFPLQSVGQCTSEQGFIFWLFFISFNVCLLLYALVLCYKTWNYPSAFAESRWITACVISYIQILLLAVPILVIVKDDNNIYFFVLTSIVFLMSMSVTLFIYLPKVVSFYSASAEGNLGQISLQFARGTHRSSSNDGPSVLISGLGPSMDNFESSSMRFNQVVPLRTNDMVERVTSAFEEPSEEHTKTKSQSSSQPYQVSESIVEENQQDLESGKVTSSSTADETDVEKGH